MKKLEKSISIRGKRKQLHEDQENDASKIEGNIITIDKKTKRLDATHQNVYGIFQNSLSTPLSVIENGSTYVKSTITCTPSPIGNEYSISNSNCQAEGRIPLSCITNYNIPSTQVQYIGENVEIAATNVNLNSMTIANVYKEVSHNQTLTINKQINTAGIQSPSHCRDLISDFDEVDLNQTSATNLFDEVQYLDFGDPIDRCEHCNSLFWYEERSNKSKTTYATKYSACCVNGKIKLPFMRTPPKKLYDLFFQPDDRSKCFLDNIRSYNNMFCFTSMGGKIDNSVNNGSAPPIFKIHGQNFHLIGSLIPEDGSRPKFAQLYIHDTEHETHNRISSVRKDGMRMNLHAEVVEDIKQVLDCNNVLVRSFRMAKAHIDSNPEIEIRIRLIGKRSSDARTYNLPTTSEVAALIVGDLDPTMGQRDILVETKTGRLQRITELHPSYLPMQYPLLFPYGEDGYREDTQFANRVNPSNNARHHISQREFFAFRIHERSNELSTLLYARRLFQQFLVDAYTMVESSRLLYIRNNQKALRVEAYKGLSDALTRGEVQPSTQGKRIILPSSFTGGARYMIQNYQDAMAICRWIGYPNLFITFTCNPKWPEIQRYLHVRNLKPEDRPDIVCRIFKMKLDCLIKELKTGKIFGDVSSVIYTIEFQKRGLPHAHILLFLAKKGDILSSKFMDKIISAEIPDKELDREYYNSVEEFMVHGPCGAARRNSPCMVNGKCSKHFPKKFVDSSNFDQDGYPIYRRRDDGKSINKSGVELDNRYVVPHNRILLLKYKAHINVEWCNQSRSIKYLFKYVNKGNDRVTAEFYRSTTDEDGKQVVDEINMYYDCRYVSACEATWRLLSFEVQYRTPSVERLSFHLPNCQSIIFQDDDSIEEVLRRETVAESMFNSWFEANSKYEEAKLLTYIEMPTKFVWKKDIRSWQPRKKGFSIGRIFYVPPGSGEIYYLRCLLNIVRGPTSFKDIRTYNGFEYTSFRDACYARGLLDDDKEYIDGIMEASEWSTAYSMRKLFVILLTTNSLIRPENVWNEVWPQLAEDAEFRQRTLLQQEDLCLTDDEKKNFALIELENLLVLQNKSLKDFHPMPLPAMENTRIVENRLLFEELNYDRQSLQQESQHLRAKLTDEQRFVYETVIQDVDSNCGGLFFVYGYGGTGKTFVWRVLSSTLRARGDIVINVASSGIASLLLPGGRTAHSRFAIPISINEDSTCNISQGSDLAELIIQTKLIIWDEAPMMHKYCFEALDRTMRDLMRFVDPSSAEKTFGGKTVLFGGDSRQILPVVPKGSRQDIVASTINSSYLWSNCRVLRLTKNLRLNVLQNGVEASQVQEFANWIASIGDGTLGGPNDGYAEVDIPKNMLLPSTGDPIVTIVESTYPMFMNGRCDTNYLDSRAILAPTLDVVNSINEYMSAMHVAESKTYLSCDTVCNTDSSNGIMANLHTPEFLNRIRASGVPNHSLTLKVGSPVMLLRNIDHSLGLCNGTRLVITKLSQHIIEGKILSGNNAGTKVLIPRMAMTPSDPRLPFKFQRRQFPLMLSYAMTINKSQGQTLSHVGLLLKKPVFVHGQLYVAASRVSKPNGLKILICNDSKAVSTSTTNVVYHEVFNNL